MNAVIEEQAVRPRPIPAEREYVTPEVNIFVEKDDYVLDAEMPGVNKEGLEITLEGNLLTLVGRRQAGVETDAQLLYRESTGADFRRSFELDPGIDAGKISAKMDQGIVRLHLPKAEKVKPRKIQIEE